MVVIDPRSPLPLYHQLKEMLLQEIRSGHYPPHTPIPPERELESRYGISRTTVRQALADLVSEGRLYRRPGRGTFVAPAPIVEPLNELKGHIEELQRRGYRPQVQLLDFARLPAPAEARAALQLAAADEVLHVRRLISVDGKPLFLLDVCLPTRLGVEVSPADLAALPLTGLLEQQKLSPARGEQRIAALAARPADAALLEMDPGAPVLQVVRTQWTADGLPLTWSRALYPGDRYQYVVELRRH